ncbi:phosphoglycerate mutase family protein [Alicyclobacillus fastidiosus]|uniref:Phosphoglycerate mutase family protein n=1 Tax=Alicyclobacillus fastidiosus TaxID=392011 RepID=A0ABY6ZAA8_9BACL|nr:histidine phosphatase family protein [Alicyclobacillus fastidiosus]WAH39796.1 phosphoglycerate mutase family protein [Alicyclobacillus fastidiosus]GMA61049.1 phosphoglycerate mutase [Alicyclobacillus fastidiosus]
MQMYVIRHCEATGQSKDAPLTAKGFAQAELLADYLQGIGIERVICSPYLRAQQTIEPYAQRLHIPVTLDGRLSERVLSTSNLDNWFECLRQTFDDFELSFDGGESSRDAVERAVDAITDFESTDPTCFAVVTHGNLMTLLLRHFDVRFGFDEWARLTNPDIFLVSIDEDKATVQRAWRDLV